MPCTSLSEASWVKNALLSTGLVGSWFLSCASMLAVPRSVVMWMSCPQACMTFAFWLA